jgi:hypothetical protein
MVLWLPRVSRLLSLLFDRKKRVARGQRLERPMPAEFSTFAIDLVEVRNALGSKSRSLLPALKKRFDLWFKNVNEQVADADAGPPLETVLKLLIVGKAIDAMWSFQFAVSIELLYRHFGVPLPGYHFQTMRIGWATEVDKAIKQTGVSEEVFGLMRHLFERGPVIPFDVEFLMGYLSLAEVRAAMEAFAQADYTGLKLDVRLAVADVRSWLVSCDTLGRDLASFYSDGA